MCGIAGAFNVPDASSVVLLMLKRLQHRGPAGAGIVSTEGQALHGLRGLGRISNVFGGVDMARRLPGRTAIGHVRYSTTGSHKAPENVQPFSADFRYGAVSIAHNGNLTNYGEVRAKLEREGAIFRTSSDTELFLHLMERSASETAAGALDEACRRVEGAYSLLVLTPDALFALRDPLGFRPLVMAPYGEGWLFASETCALDLFTREGVREVKAGQAFWVGSDRASHVSMAFTPQARQCSFEHIYFSRPDSIVFGVSADAVRKRLGEALGRKETVSADLCCGVPDSANAMAVGYARASGLPLELALIRDHETGRTFIEGEVAVRIEGVLMKLGVVAPLVRGRRVVLVDDSIVRGTTMRKVVAMLREAGAVEVHVRIGSPRVIHPCYWGIATPSFQELAAHRFPGDLLRREIDADSLGFLMVEELKLALRDPAGERHCTTCFTGVHPDVRELVPPSSLVKKIAGPP